MMTALLAGTSLMSALLTYMFREIARRRHLLDPLTPRSSHSRPTPRLGGPGIVLSVLAGIVGLQMIAPAFEWRVCAAFLAGGAIAAATGLVDDIIGLRPWIKLLGQAAAVAPVVAVVPFSFPGLPSTMAAIAWLLAVIGYINFFNFFDGSDGLAAGVAAINAVVLGMLAWPAPWSAVLFVVAAAAIGFLLFNRAPASVFMGDSGSLFLGYVFGALSAILVASGISPVAVALALAPIAFDCTFTLLRRLAAGERVWEAHRSHLYQRLLIAGWSHASVAALYWSWAVLAGGTALGFSALEGWRRVSAALMGVVASAAVHQLVRRVERRAASGMLIA